jgi:hypothetical protein
VQFESDFNSKLTQQQDESNMGMDLGEWQLTEKVQQGKQWTKACKSPNIKSIVKVKETIQTHEHHTSKRFSYSFSLSHLQQNTTNKYPNYDCIHKGKIPVYFHH